jgi:hypothetical protein
MNEYDEIENLPPPVVVAQEDDEQKTEKTQTLSLNVEEAEETACHPGEYKFSFIKTDFYSKPVHFHSPTLVYVTPKFFTRLQKWFKWFQDQENEKEFDLTQIPKQTIAEQEWLYKFQQWISYTLCRA